MSKGTGQRDLLARMDDAARRSLVHQAIIRCTPGSKHGSRSVLWERCQYADLFDLACLHLVDHKSSAESRSIMGAKLGKPRPNERVVDRWLRTIRTEFKKLQDELVREQAAASELIPITGDLPAQLGIVWRVFTTKFVGYLSLASWGDLSTAERHTMLRFMKALNEAAKIQAEARRTEAQTDVLLGKIHDLAHPDAPANKNETPEQKQARLAKLVDELIGLRGGKAVTA